MIEFKGRVLISDNGEGVAVVTKKQVMFIDAFEESAENKSKKLIFNDKSHLDIYKKNLTGKVFVLPSFKKSDIDGAVLLSLAKKGNLPKCFLIAEKLDEVAVSAFSVLKVFLKNSVAVVDTLGKDFLASIENGDTISYKDDLVTINL